MLDILVGISLGVMLTILAMLTYAYSYGLPFFKKGTVILSSGATTREQRLFARNCLFLGNYKTYDYIHFIRDENLTVSETIEENTSFIKINLIHLEEYL